MTDPCPLTFGPIQALPLIHGRLPFAIEARRQLLSARFGAVAVELPPSLQPAIFDGLDALPAISVVVYRDHGGFDASAEHERTLFYVPVDPADGMVEALRIARGERTPVHFVDAEVQDFQPYRPALPDPHALLGLGLSPWWNALLPNVRALPRNPQDDIRERHMAFQLNALVQKSPAEPILFLCGLAHWEAVRSHLEHGTFQAYDQVGPAAHEIERSLVHPRSLPHLLGELPHLVYRWEQHRGGLDFDDFDQVLGLKDLLLVAREHYEHSSPDALERVTPRALQTLLTYARKLTVSAGRLIPDGWTLATAAKGCVGHDFAVSLLISAHRYPPNGDLEIDPPDSDDPEVDEADAPAEMTGETFDDDGVVRSARPRTPGAAMSWRPLKLRLRPPRKDQHRWKRGWNPHVHCSWPPEDRLIEGFRSHISQRALSLAGVDRHRTEPFTTSLKDGLALRETLRDWHRKRIHVKEEPPVAGQIGAVVVIFETDEDGTRFPWRTTWMAEHDEESTLAFYATDPLANLVGPGIGRIDYGGCLFLFPPKNIRDIWEDLRFERARFPSERLLLSALWYSEERYVAYVAQDPPAPEVRAEAERLGRHIVFLPLSGFSSTTLEKLRRAHVLNGQYVRGWADRFIR